MIKVYRLNLSLFFLTILGVSVLFSCTLTSQQETQLNADLNNLIIVRNEGDALSFMDYTHPTIVKHHKQKGNTPFKKRFQEVPKKLEQIDKFAEITFWNKGYVKSTISKDTMIQAKIQITLIKDNVELDSSLFYFGITSKNISNWTFVSESDYFTIFPKNLRLFSE